MPSGTGDQSQQPPVSNGSGFPGSSLYPNQNIWQGASSFGSRPLGQREADPDNSSYAAQRHSNAEGDSLWGSGPTYPWNTANSSRPVSTSPSRTRNGLSNPANHFQPSQPAIGRMSGGHDVDDTNPYSHGFQGRKRTPQEAYTDNIGVRNSSRESTFSSSRQSQTSNYPDRFRNGHASSNSMQSQRGSGQASNLPSHSSNARAFSINGHIDEELSRNFRAIGLDGSGSLNSAESPSTSTFQLNPVSQPWSGNGDGMGSGYDGGWDNVPDFSGMRQPVSRNSPGPNYRVDNSSSPRNSFHGSDSWNGRRSSRDNRNVYADPREMLQSQQSAARHGYMNNAFDAASYQGQYPLSNLNNYHPGYQQPMMSNYGLSNGATNAILNMVPGALANGQSNGMSNGFANGLTHALLNDSANGFANGHSNSLMSSPSPFSSRREQDPMKGVRSALLHEFRSSSKSSKRWELRDIRNHVVEFSGDQHGSRFIQQKLETANSDDKDQIFKEIEPNAIQLMKDVFGNYVVQKLFEHGNQVQKRVLAEKMKGKVVDVSMQTYACRVVQKAMEHVLVDQQAELTKELENDILKVIRDQNGNHVVQKIIELVPRQHLDFIMDAVRSHVTTLATHMYGCRVIQRMLEHGTETDKKEIMAELHSSVQVLITDQFGNYVAQHVIQNGKDDDSQQFIKLIMDNLATFSKHKFASNVVEKCIEHATTPQRSRIRELLAGSSAEGSTDLQQMIKDQFGNYVIQKLLGRLQGQERNSFIEELRPHYFTLKRLHGNSKQLQALEKVLEVGPNSTGEDDAQGVDAGPASNTPNLTNNTNTPQSSSPPSTRTSTINDLVSGEGGKSNLNSVTNGTAPKVQETDV